MAKYKRPKPPLKYHGGLHYHAEKIVSHFPKRDTYDHFIDGCVGGGSILLAHDPEGKAEIINDTNGDLSNFWGVLSNPPLRDKLIERLNCTGFTEAGWKNAVKCLAITPADPHRAIDRAVWYFTVARQSLAGRHGKNAAFAAITKTRLRAGMQEQVSAWWSAVAGLHDVGERLSRVLVLNRDVVKLVKDWDVPRAFIFLDPPWLDETRKADQVYDQEMPREKHIELLDAIDSCKNAMVMIAGRRSMLYHERLMGWKGIDITHKSSSGGGKKKGDMNFCLWTNYL